MALTRIKVLSPSANINVNSINVASTLTVSGNLVAGNVTTTSSGGSVNVPKISSIAVTNSSFVANGWQAVSNTGGYIIVNGSGFVSGAVVLIGNKTASATTFANNSFLQVQVPAQTEGTYPVYVTNPDGGVAINVPGLNYSPTPVWTSNSTLPGGVAGSAISIQLTATDTTTVTYSLAAGSTLPPGLSLSSSGLLSGTVTGISGVTVYTFGVVAVDTYSQNTSQTFSITISVGDTYFPYTSLLLSANTNSANTSGTSNANTVIDSSYNYNNITRAGNPGQGSFNPFGTTWSNYFGGTGNYLNAGTSSQFAFGTGNFTAEAWIYNTGTTAAYGLIVGATVYGTSTNFQLYLNGTNNSLSYIGPASTTVSTASSSVMPNTWYHVAIVRNGTTVTVYINGVSSASVTDSNSIPSTTALTIGNASNNNVNAQFIGYISNVRIVNGTAVYTDNFTPSTVPLTAISGTTLLTSQSNRFVDKSTANSGSGFAITPSGNTSVQRFNPFGSNATPYATSSNTYIGSTYFGTADTLQAASSTNFGFGTGDFTMECWFYSTTTSISAQQLLDARTSNVQVAPSIVINGSNQLIYFVSGGTVITGSTITQNTWNHMALSRISGITKLFLNGTQTGSSYTDSNSYITAPMWIGSTYIGPYFTGYISNVRVIKGTGLYSSNFIPTISPLTVVANTSLLTCQSTQTVTYDANTTPNRITVGAGTPRPTKSVPFSQSWAGQFNGSSAYLTSGSSASPLSAFNFATGDFTVESWVYLTTTGSKPIVDFRGASTVAPAIGFYTGNQPYLYYNGSIVYQPSSLSLTVNTWSHIALVRSSGVSKFYLNGIGAATTYTDTNNYPAAPIVIGTDTIAGGSNWWSGYLSNIRIVKGTAVYTSNFTPSNTPLTAIANTVLLTCQNGSSSNTFIDNSTANGGIGFTITNNGTPGANVVSMAAPGYSPMPIVDTSSITTTYGGSYYFNGTTDYLTVPYSSAINLATGAPNWTVEFWIYPTSLAAVGSLLLKDYIFGTNFPLYGGFLNTNGTIQWYVGNGVANQFAITSTAISVNAWYHLAFVRNGSTLTIYVNGVSGGSTTISTAMTDNGGPLYIGAYSTPGGYFPGYFSNIRIIKGQALYTSSFTPSTTPLSPSANIAYSGPANTALLLSGTNAGAYDSTMINEFINVGGVSVNSNVKQYGTTSYYFNGSGYLYQSTSPSLQMSGDFTLEFWAYPTNVSATQTVVEIGRPSNGATPGFQIDIISGVVYVYYGTSIASSITGSSVSNNTWYHLALTRSSSNLRLFVNGVQAGSTVTDSTSYSQAYLWIGANPGGASYFSGYIQDLRITKGIARYTSNFTVPSTTFLAQ